MKHIHLLKECLPITKLSQQRFVWADIQIWRKQPKPHSITCPCLATSISTINIRYHIRFFQEIYETPRRTNMWTSTMLKNKENKFKTRSIRLETTEVNEVNKRKRTFSSKLKAVSQEERIQMWKDHFKNLLGKSTEVSDKLITKNY